MDDKDAKALGFTTKWMMIKPDYRINEIQNRVLGRVTKVDPVRIPLDFKVNKDIFNIFDSHHDAMKSIGRTPEQLAVEEAEAKAEEKPMVRRSAPMREDLEEIAQPVEGMRKVSVMGPGGVEKESFMLLKRDVPGFLGRPEEAVLPDMASGFLDAASYERIYEYEGKKEKRSKIISLAKKGMEELIKPTKVAPGITTSKKVFKKPRTTVKEKKIKTVKKKRRRREKSDLDVLLNIKGISKERLKDIKRVYRNLAELKAGLKGDKVPLRNDIVKKLRMVYG